MRVYEPLAAALVAASPVRLSGRVVLDLGAGTGAASRAVLAAGGRPLAFDLSLGMLRHDRSRRPAALCGDVRRLPLRSRCVGAVVAAFVLNHLPDPVAALRGAGRVTEPEGPVLASTFSSSWSHPAKERVEQVAAAFGFRRPAWYDFQKAAVEPLLGDAAAFAAAADAAGLAHVTVEERQVDTGLPTAADLVAWRLGMAHLAPFVAGLEPRRRAALITGARAALDDRPQPLRPVVLILSSRAAV